MSVSAIPEARVAAWIAHELRGVGSVLDLGCGLGEYLGVGSVPHRCGLDVFEPYVAACRERFGDLASLKVGDLRSYREIFDHPHEVALLIDVIEHLEKPEGVALLTQLREDVSKILVFTPLGYHEQGEIDGNPAQRHLSAWFPADLEVLGFETASFPDFHHGNPVEKRGALVGVWRKA